MEPPTRPTDPCIFRNTAAIVDGGIICDSDDDSSVSSDRTITSFDVGPAVAELTSGLTQPLGDLSVDVGNAGTGERRGLGSGEMEREDEECAGTSGKGVEGGEVGVAEGGKKKRNKRGKKERGEEEEEEEETCGS